MKLVSIVEGHGDQRALPVLLRRLALAITPGSWVEVPRPIRIPRSTLLKPGELERAVSLAAFQAGADDGIIIILDADDDCPAILGEELRRRARATRSDRRIALTLANREFEAWFLAAASSLAGHCSLLPHLEAPADPEGIRDAKGWLTRHSVPGQPYKETLNQPAMAELMDLEAARRAASFRKLWRDVAWLLAPADAAGQS